MKIGRIVLISMVVPSLIVPAIDGMADDSSSTEPTFNNEVVRIFQENCQNCHRPGQIAPMSLLSFAEARPWAKSIKKAVAERNMPPWHADPNIGEFRNDISLSDEEVATIVRWVDSGAPEGDPDHAPEPIEWDNQEWLGGTPDVVLKPTESFTVPATGDGEDVFQCFVLPTGFTEDTWIQGIELHAGDARVVHHLLGFIDNAGTTQKLDEATPEPGYPCDMSGIGVPFDGLAAGHAPGTPPTIYKAGTGKLASAGANIVLQLHYYNKTGAPVEDASYAGIHIAKEPIKNLVRIWPVSQFKIDIKAGDPNAEHVAQWRPTKDILLSGIMPHMHFLGKDMTLYLDYTDGTTETILSVPRFDFNWQIAYELMEPKLIPRGTTIRVVGHHDNSADNPHNPSNPPVDVRFGESTGDEMMIGWVAYTYADEDLRETASK